MAVDGLIASGWLLLAVLFARLWRRVGVGAWREWQQALEWDPRDETVMRGLHALERVKDYATDGESNQHVAALLRYSHDALGGDLLAGVPRWRGQARLLSLSPEVCPLRQRELADPWLRALARVEGALLVLPGRPRTLVRLRRHLAALDVAARLAQWRTKRHRQNRGLRAGLRADRRALERAALDAHTALREGLKSRREQLGGARH